MGRTQPKLQAMVRSYAYTASEPYGPYTLLRPRTGHLAISLAPACNSRRRDSTKILVAKISAQFSELSGTLMRSDLSRLGKSLLRELR